MGRKKKYATEEERLEAIRESKRKWRENNKEKRAECNKQWREKNAEYDKQYYQANKEKRTEQMKQWYKANREKRFEYDKQYYQANKEKIVEYKKQWYQDNKERIAEQHKTPMGRASYMVRAYKQADKKYNRGECTLTVKWIVDHIFTQKCIYCGESDWNELGCDRIDNSKPHTEDNVVCSCEACNKKRGLKPFQEFLAECKQKDLEDIAIK